MYYLVTIGYETDQTDRNGNVRLQKIKYVVQAQSVEELTIIVGKYRSGDMRSSEIVSINKIEIDCVIDEKNSPEYYK